MTDATSLQGLFIVVMGAVVMVALRLVQRIVELKHQRPPVTSLDLVRERLDRIEAAVESTAVEVERISESHRFMARLLSERSHVAGIPTAPERVITPH